jgi:hypothetical protein
VEFLLEMSDLGLGYTRDMVKDAIMYLLRDREHSFGPGGPSDKWMYLFFEKFPQISIRKPENLSKNR